MGLKNPSARKNLGIRILNSSKKSLREEVQALLLAALRVVRSSRNQQCSRTVAEQGGYHLVPTLFSSFAFSSLKQGWREASPDSESIAICL